MTNLLFRSNTDNTSLKPGHRLREDETRLKNKAKRHRRALWRDLWGGGIIGVMVFSAWLLFIGVGALAAPGVNPDHPDIFTREDIRIEAGQTVGRLLVTGGVATVGGVVEEGVVVVDGNLVLTPDAHIKGVVVVLGGQVSRADGARLDKPVVALAAGRAPVGGFVALSLLLLGAAALVALPAALWLTARLAKDTRPYLWMKKWFLLLQRRWPALYIMVTLAVSGLMLAFFTELAWETMFCQQTDVFDNVFIWLVRYFSSPALDRAMIVISEFGYGGIFWTIAVAAAVTLAFYRRLTELAGMLVCLSGAAFLNFLLKHLFERSRPDLFRVVEAAGYSFPSGHAMVSLCFYGILAFLLSRHIRDWRWRLAVATLAAALVAAIGVSRVYLGVHYPTDVIAGYTAGGMWLGFCISSLLWWERERPEKAAK